MNNPSRDMSFLDHLEELRWHIIRSTISVLIVAVIAFLAKDIIFDQIIFGPKKGDFISYQVFCSISQSIEVMPSALRSCHSEFKAEQFLDNFLPIFGHQYLLGSFLHFHM